MTDVTALAKKTPLLASVPPLPPSRFAGMVRGPGELLCRDGIIFDKLELEIRRFLFQQILPSKRETAPRFLVIQGQPGTGKTVAACDAALRFGFLPAIVPVATFASPNEGGAVSILDELMADMEQQSRQRNARLVVVKDDMDLGIGSLKKDTGHTVNSGLLVGHLQYYADNRNLGRNVDGSTIAFIVTGNDFSSMRSSLFRDNRATWYTHAPDAEDKLQLAFHVLKPRGAVELHLVEKLFRTYRHESVAFWQALRSDLDARRLDEIIEMGLPDVATAERELARQRPISPEQLWALAKARSTTKAASFL